MILNRIIKRTAGGFHCWVETPIGIIRKLCKDIPQELWDIFEGRRETPNPIDIIRNQQIENEKLSIRPLFIPSKPKVAEIKINWWQTLWLKIKKIFLKIFGMKH
jgi:hypothetical protein